MTETSKAKQIQASEVTSIPYMCPNCGAQVGELVPVDGDVLLDAGGWLISNGRRHCHRCGRLIHVRPPRDAWPVLVERHIERYFRQAG